MAPAELQVASHVVGKWIMQVVKCPVINASGNTPMKVHKLAKLTESYQDSVRGFACVKTRLMNKRPFFTNEME